jgi:hypothetical protein
MQLTNTMYSFLQEPFFSLDFRIEFNEASAYRGNCPMGSVVKHMDYPKRKGERGILILVRLYMGSYQTLRP